MKTYQKEDINKIMVEQEIELQNVPFQIPKSQIEQNQNNYHALFHLFLGIIKFSGMILLALFLTYVAPLLIFLAFSRIFGKTIFSLTLTFISLMIFIILIALFKKKEIEGR